jgi:glutamyl-tRNA synthetase
MPREGVCRFTDLIRGEMEVEWAREQDHVIQRADGSCLYNLASVVDDAEMEITHVIRAEEHLSNTPRQIFIAQGLGHALPAYAHLPFVAEPGSRNKLSKRKLDQYLRNPDFARLNDQGRTIAEAIGLTISPETFSPVVVDFYERTGFLPEAVVNSLLMLGWALDDRTEMFTRDEMIRHFALERVNRAPASFDPAKLMAFESRYMQACPVERKVEGCLPFLEGAGVLVAGAAPAARERVRRVIDAAGERITVMGDILSYTGFFLPDDRLTYDEDAFDRRLRRPPEAAVLLRRLGDRLAAAPSFAAAALEALVQEFTREEGIGMGQIVHALRVAVTGKAIGFGLFDSLAILGREAVTARIGRALARLV